MRTVTFILGFHGDFEVEVVDHNLKTLKKAHLEEFYKEIGMFNPLEGFKEEFWDMQVKNFQVKDKQITILV